MDRRIFQPGRFYILLVPLQDCTSHCSTLCECENLQGKSFQQGISDELVCWKLGRQGNSNPLNMDRRVLHFPLLLKQHTISLLMHVPDCDLIFEEKARKKNQSLTQTIFSTCTIYTVLNCCVAAYIVERPVGTSKRHACTFWTVMTGWTYVLVWNSTSIAAVVSR